MAHSKLTVSIVVVAKEAGVSLQTVSNVLNFPERVKPETQQKVLKAIAKLNYTPNLSARRLRSRKSSSIAVRLDTNASENASAGGLFSGYIQDEYAYQLVKAASLREVKVVAYTCGPKESEVDKLKKLVDSREVDGFLLTSTIENDKRLTFLTEQGVPFLSFGRPWGTANEFSTSYPWIDIDGASGTSDATNMFWTLGYREIGFIGWKTFSIHPIVPRSVGDDRFLGWSQTLAKNLMVRDLKMKRNHFELGYESIVSARKAARALLEKLPTLEAVVCASDTLALGAQLEFQSLTDRKIPISGFDNSPISREFHFTSLDQNLAEIASRSLNVLIGDKGNDIRIRDFSEEPENAHIIMKPKLVIR